MNRKSRVFNKRLVSFFITMSLLFVVFSSVVISTSEDKKDNHIVETTEVRNLDLPSSFDLRDVRKIL